MSVHSHKIKLFAGLLLVILISLAYRWISIPTAENSFAYTLQMSPASKDIIAQTLTENPWRVLLPLDHGGGRYLWSPTLMVPLYGLTQILSPVQLYLLATSLMVAVLYGVGYALTKSLKFAVSLGVIAALSTFLNYALVYGNLIGMYFFIIYMALTALCMVNYLRDTQGSWNWFIGLTLSMLLLIFGLEYWLNLSVSLLLGFVFIALWARHHDKKSLGRKVKHLSIFLVAAMVIYLGLRGQYNSMYLQPGFENELVFAYEHPLLMLEDMTVNYFTYVYITVSSILPGFLSFSPSYTFLGPDVITAEQHGYHSAYSHLIIASHLSSWRFIAGGLLVGLALLLWSQLKAAWQNTDPKYLISVMLIVIVLTGFSIYIPIKMRPMHMTAMLGYKTTVSSTALMVLLAWMIYRAGDWNVSKHVQKSIMPVVLSLIVVAAFTRPISQISGLNAVGLSGAGNPFDRISSNIKNDKQPD